MVLFMPRYVPLEGNHTIDLVFDDGCHIGVTVDMPTSTPTATPTDTPTPTITPTPDCSRYALTAFSFMNGEQLRARMGNNDVVDTSLVSLELIWDYAEDLGALNGYNNLNADWYKWNGEIILHHLPGPAVCHLSPEAITGGILTLILVGARAVP